jgi:NAD(P)-dependent dehydrogenase (short-subunit alcohol dehydrogenase family)
MSQKLSGKVALVTGGSSGIGLATAKRFVAEGAYVFITGRRQTELDAAVKEIGKNVMGTQGNVSNLADLDRLYATIEQKQGHSQKKILFAAPTPCWATFQLTHQNSYLKDLAPILTIFLQVVNNIQNFNEARAKVRQFILYSRWNLWISNLFNNAKINEI